MTNPKWNSMIADGTPADRLLLKTLLKSYCPQVKIVAEASTVAETVACIQSHEVRLVFCNVSLNDGEVFEVIDQVNGLPVQIVIMAPDDGFALRAFRYKAFDYLLKPLSPEVLLNLVGRLDAPSFDADVSQTTPANFGTKQKFGTILLNAAGVQHVVQVPDIVHLEGDGNYATVHISSGEKILVSKPLKHFEDILPAKYFYRVHQSHIVNLAFVKSVQNGDSQMINLSNGKSVPLARRKKDPFLLWLSRQ
jgi:two-component system LytT family response regulator